MSETGAALPACNAPPTQPVRQRASAVEAPPGVVFYNAAGVRSAAGRGMLGRTARRGNSGQAVQ